MEEEEKNKKNDSVPPLIKTGGWKRISKPYSFERLLDTDFAQTRFSMDSNYRPKTLDSIEN